MTLPPGYKVTELKNVVVADPVCQSSADSWTASYKTGQTFHIEVDVPETSAGVVYGLNQTLLLAVRSSIYGNTGGEDIELLRTPENTEFNFKRGWLDSEVSDDNHPSFPYYNDEAVAKTALREHKVDGKDAYYVSLRIRKTPVIELPTWIQRKDDPNDKRRISQLDVHERHLITLFRDEDVKNGKPTPIMQWAWEHKHAWCDNGNGEPRFVTHPSFTEQCKPMSHFTYSYKLKGSTSANTEHYEQFLVLDPDGLCFLDEKSKHKVTDEWETCDIGEAPAP